MNDQDSSNSEGSSLRRQPKQNRSVETRNNIIEAAGQLFSEQGYENTTTHHVAARANVSVGALYRYFSDKEAILRELYQREMSQLRDRILEEFADIDVGELDVRATVREALGRAFNIFSERVQLRRVLGEASRKVTELAEIRRNQEEQVYQSVGNILAAVPEVELEDAETGGYLIALFCESVLEDFLLFRQESGKLDRERVLDETTEVIVRYLRLK